MQARGLDRLGRALEQTYALYNAARYIHPDPLEFLAAYPALEDREIVGLVASSLAYGRVTGILASVAKILDVLGPHPRGYLEQASLGDLLAAFDGFKHRFTTGEDMAHLLAAATRVAKAHGSLGEAFGRQVGPGDDTVVPATERFVDMLAAEAGRELKFLLPSPRLGSACKRFNLFLRWMIRHDDVDPGGWDGSLTRLLVVPLDTHMHRIARSLGLTSRRSGDMRTALEITMAFARFSPDDPVKYDFALTRLGIQTGLPVPEALARMMEDQGPNSPGTRRTV